MTDNNLPPERDVKDFGFQQLCKLRVWNGREVPQAASSSDAVQMLCVSNQFGLTFVAYQQGFKVIKTSEIASIDERHIDDRSTAIDETLPILATVLLTSAPVFLALSCDDLTLIAVTQTEAQCPEANLFDICLFAAQTSPAVPFSKLFLSNVRGCRLVDGVWNPAVPNLFATCLSDGSAQLWSIVETMNLIAMLPCQTMATCLCWSPRGKQLILGKGDGTMCQYDQALVEKKKWPYPAGVLGPDQTQICKVLNVLWESTFTVISVYVPIDIQGSEQQPYVIVTTIPKDGNPSMINFEDICYGTGEERSHKYFMNHIPKWEMIVTASANALEAAILAKNPDDKKIWERWNLDESSRAEMPLTVDQADTFPVGLAVDFTSQTPIKLSADKQSLQPCPMLLLLSTVGVLVPFYMTYARPGILTLTSAPNILKTEGMRISADAPIQRVTTNVANTVPGMQAEGAFNWSLSQFAQKAQQPSTISQLPSITSQSTPMASILTSGVGQSSAFGQPQDLSKMGQFSNNQLNGAKVQEQPVNMKNKLEPSSQPSSTLQTPKQVVNKGFSFTPQTSVSSVQQPNALIGTPILSGSNASVPTAVTGKFTPQTPVKPPPVKLAASTPDVNPTQPSTALTEKQDSINLVVDSEFTGNILDEIAHFERELHELKERNQKTRVNLGTKSEQQNLRDKTTEVFGFCQQIRDTTKFHHKEICELKTHCLDLMSRVEEVRVRQERNKDGHYHNLLKSRSLDPASVELMRNLHQQCQCVERNVQNLDVILDEQWDNYQAEKKSKNKSICAPRSDAIYRVLKSNHNLMQVQKSKLDEVQENLTQLRLHNKISPWKTTRNTIDTANHNRISFIRSALDSPDSNKSATSTPRRSQSRYLGPDAQKKLREFLSKRSVPKVYSTAPTNLSSSKLLLNSSRASLFNKSQSSTPSGPVARSTPAVGRIAPVTGNQFERTPKPVIDIASHELSAVTTPAATEVTRGSITRGEAATDKASKASALLINKSLIAIQSGVVKSNLHLPHPNTAIQTAEPSVLVANVLPRPDYQTQNEGDTLLSTVGTKTGSILASQLIDNSPLSIGVSGDNLTAFNFQSSSTPVSTVAVSSAPGTFFLSGGSTSAGLVSKSTSSGASSTSMASSAQSSTPTAKVNQHSNVSAAAAKPNIAFASKNLFGSTSSVFSATTQSTLDLTSSKTSAWPSAVTTVADLSTSKTTTTASNTGFDFNAASSQTSGFSFTPSSSGFSFSMSSLPNSVKENTESASSSLAIGGIPSFTGAPATTASSLTAISTSVPASGFSFSSQFATLSSSKSTPPANTSSEILTSTATDVPSEKKAGTVIQTNLPDIATSSKEASAVVTNPSVINTFSFKPPGTGDSPAATQSSIFGGTSASTTLSVTSQSLFGGFGAVTNTWAASNTAKPPTSTTSEQSFPVLTSGDTTTASSVTTTVTSVITVASVATPTSVFGNKDKAITNVAPKQQSSLLGNMLSGTESVTSTTAVVTIATTSSVDSAAGIFGQALQGSVFGSNLTAPATAFSVFGTSSAATVTGTNLGPFGISSATTTAISSTFVSSTTASTSSIFGQAAVIGTGFTAGSSPQAVATSPVSFSPSRPLFGQPTTESGSIFGGSSTPATPSTASGVTSVFGGQSSPFVQTTQAGYTQVGSVFGQSGSVFGASASVPAAGGGGFLAGLGGKPSSENVNKNVFASSAALGTSTSSTPSSIFGLDGAKCFGSPTFGSTGGFSTSVFGGGSGQTAGFGTSVFGGTGSGVAASGFAVSQSPPQSSAGFGASQGFGSPPAFGGSPGFGSPATFGGSPTFGATGAFGGAGFSSPVASTGDGIFGQGDNQQSGGFTSFANTGSTFGNMAAQCNTATFGGLAQGNTSTFGSTSPSSFGSATFGGGAVNTEFGSSTFGSSPSFSGYRS